ncbi:leucyl/phenylalanyl-tRNA--protein transferase [Alphaproteobacteria bacterium GH1-50]|uniref:Leucyl/phenylalanyl-tRNA--protein transferase n=1 Tax=Kangsaoukella pontilimi TaxID=2691042 RepID=A0A7C9NCJ8_9RHOB|nr:leucyl/phenylalanyl-tRNA--protein transferase [Kangsaoukella pontilimi]MXQ06739.1 leucyl/phenylalanyl-tRNA--protein transferase [Kangsaoukella pontilimi]
MSGRSLTPELLLGAYASGVFPMADSRDDPAVYWVEPRRRGIIPMDWFRVSRSLAKRLKKPDYSVHLNEDFAAVLNACADRPETWINDTIRDLMLALHDRGIAHAFSVRTSDGALIGGMYGLALGGAFFGESMFSRQRDGSKIALTWAIDHLRRTGFTLFDTQFITEHLRSLGAEEIPKEEYMERLRRAITEGADIHALPLETDRQAVVQRMTQTS